MITATISMEAAMAASDLLTQHGHKNVADALFALTNDTACIELAGHPVEDFDNTQAKCECWAIFDCDGSENGRWQICSLDDPSDHPDWDGKSNLANDEAAWAHVVRQAQVGSQYHLNALTFIRQHNPLEWVALCKAHPEVKTRVRVHARSAA